MPEPPLTNSGVATPQPPDWNDKKPEPNIQRRPKKARSRRLWALVVLVILVLACANVLALWTLYVSIRSEEIAGDLDTGLVNAPTSDPLSLPEARRALPESTPTATRVVLYPPTAQAAPTPTPAPTLVPTPPPPVLAKPIPAPPEASEPDSVNYVVIISIDGLRPDALEQADTPTLDSLIDRGAYSPAAQTVRVSETLPGHASMLGGMTPEKHGIVWGLPYIGWPGMNGPTLFSVAHDAGLSTAMVYGKEKLDHLVLPNSVDKRFRADAHDSEVTAQAVDFIEAGLPNVLFIHLPDTDRVGHAHGWMSANQLDAVAFADQMIGKIVAALEEGNYLRRTLLIVTSDHGGHGKRHGDDSPEDRTIPWLAVGPGVLEGHTLTQPINTYDTAATALYALELPIPQTWDGRPVLEMFE